MTYMNREEFEKLSAGDRTLRDIAAAFGFLVLDYGFGIRGVFSPGTSDYDYRDGTIVAYASELMELRIFVDNSVHVAICTFIDDESLNSLPGFSFDNRCMNLLDTLDVETLRSYRKALCKTRTDDRRLALLARYARENLGHILGGNIRRLLQLLQAQSEKQAMEKALRNSENVWGTHRQHP